VALIGAAVMSAVLIIFADPIIVAFAGDDPQMRSIGALCIRLQCLALPVHSWVAVVNMLCAGLGNAGGAFLLATSRQGSCMLPILFPLAHFLAEYGIASVQAVADVLSLVFAIPICIHMMKKIKAAQNEMTLQ
jgi:Na+-driven multidrug efflux pump